MGKPVTTEPKLEYESRWQRETRTKPFYKLVSKKGKAVNGGYGSWRLPTFDAETQEWTPGEWMPTVGWVKCCQSGYHLMRPAFAAKWLVNGSTYSPRLYLAEFKGSLDWQVSYEMDADGSLDKISVQSARLTRLVIGEAEWRTIHADTLQMLADNLWAFEGTRNTDRTIDEVGWNGGDDGLALVNAAITALRNGYAPSDLHSALLGEWRALLTQQRRSSDYRNRLPMAILRMATRAVHHLNIGYDSGGSLRTTLKNADDWYYYIPETISHKMTGRYGSARSTLLQDWVGYRIAEFLEGASWDEEIRDTEDEADEAPF